MARNGQADLFDKDAQADPFGGEAAPVYRLRAFQFCGL
jgi:hypothetical protein